MKKLRILTRSSIISFCLFNHAMAHSGHKPEDAWKTLYHQLVNFKWFLLAAAIFFVAWTIYKNKER